MTSDDHGHDRLQRTLDAILEEQRKTNGRVGRLEDRAKDTDLLLYGNDRIGTRGLVSAAAASEDMLRQWNVLLTWGKRVTVTFVGAIVVGLVNLAVGVLA